MGNPHSWQLKLDAYGRMQLAEGLSPRGVDVSIQLGNCNASCIKKLKAAGLELHAQIGDIVTGRVASATELEKIAQLAFVLEIQLPRQLYAEPESSARTPAHEERQA